jgi:hypothetical protein
MQQSSLIGKIEKAKRYAQQPERVQVDNFEATFKGDNNNYKTGFKDGKWHCTCSFFSQMGICSHTMALQKIMRPMLSEEALATPYGNIPV